MIFNFTLQTNFNDLHPTLHDTPKPTYQPTPKSKKLQYTTITNQLTALKYNTNFNTPKIQLHDKTLYISNQQYKYRNSRKTIDHTNQILMNNLPQNIKKINVTQKRKHITIMTTETDITNLHKQLTNTTPNQSKPLQQQHIKTKNLSTFNRNYRIHKNHFNYSFNPTLSQSLNNPKNFYIFQLKLISNTHY